MIVNKYVLITVLLIFFSSFAFADIGYVNQTMELYADVIGNGTFYPADSANISIFNPNGTPYIQNQEMNTFGIGKFIYNFTPNESGTWYAVATFYNSSADVITVASQSFAVLSDVLEEFNMFLAPYLIILIGILFAILGQYIKNATFFFVSGVWFIGSAAAGLIFLNSTIPEMMMYFLVGLALIYHGYDFINKNAEKNQRFVKIEE